MIMPEQLTLAPPICRLAEEVLSIGRRVMQKGVVFLLDTKKPDVCIFPKIGFFKKIEFI